MITGNRKTLTASTIMATVMVLFFVVAHHSSVLDRQLPVHRSIKMPYTQLAKNPNMSGTSRKLDLFPTLQVYDSRGRSLVQGKEINEDLDILAKLSSNRVESFGSAREPSLEETLREMGLDQMAASQDFKNGKMTALSIMLEQCDSCVLQQNSIQSLQEKLPRQRQMNTLTVTLTLS